MYSYHITSVLQLVFMSLMSKLQSLDLINMLRLCDNKIQLSTITTKQNECIIAKRTTQEHISSPLTDQFWNTMKLKVLSHCSIVIICIQTTIL